MDCKLNIQTNVKSDNRNYFSSSFPRVKIYSNITLLFDLKENFKVYLLLFLFFAIIIAMQTRSVQNFVQLTNQTTQKF